MSKRPIYKVPKYASGQEESIPVELDVPTSPVSLVLHETLCLAQSGTQKSSSLFGVNNFNILNIVHYILQYSTLHMLIYPEYYILSLGEGPPSQTTLSRSILLGIKLDAPIESCSKIYRRTHVTCSSQIYFKGALDGQRLECWGAQFLPKFENKKKQHLQKCIPQTHKNGLLPHDTAGLISMRSVSTRTDPFSHCVCFCNCPLTQHPFMCVRVGLTRQLKAHSIAVVSTGFRYPSAELQHHEVARYVNIKIVPDASIDNHGTFCRN